MRARPHPLDPGLQWERTVLSWRRTTLCAVVVGILVVRLTAVRSVVGTVVLVAVGTVVALALVVAVNDRMRARHREFRGAAEPAPTVRPGARLLLLVCLAVSSLALVGALGVISDL